MNSLNGESRRGSTTSVSHSEASPHPQHGRWFSSPYESAVMAVYSTSPPGCRRSPTPSSCTPNPPHRPPVVPQRPASARQEGRQPPRSFHIGIRPNSAKVGGGLIPTINGHDAAVLPSTTISTPKLTHHQRILPRCTSACSSLPRSDTPSEFTVAADTYLRRRPSGLEEDSRSIPTSGDRHQSYIDNIMRRIGMGGGNSAINDTPDNSPHPPHKSAYGLRANTRLSTETSPTRPQSGASQGGLSASGRGGIGGGVFESSSSWRVRPPTAANPYRPASSSVRVMMTPSVDDDNDIADALQSGDFATTSAIEPTSAPLADVEVPASPRPSAPRPIEAIERSPTPTVQPDDTFADTPPPVASKYPLPRPGEPVEVIESSSPSKSIPDAQPLPNVKIDQSIAQDKAYALADPAHPKTDGYYHYFEGVNKVSPASPAASPAAATDGYYEYFNSLTSLPKLVEESPIAPVVADTACGSEASVYDHYFNTLPTATPQAPSAPQDDEEVDVAIATKVDEDPIQKHARSVSSMRKERPPSAAASTSATASNGTASSSFTAPGGLTATAQCDALLQTESEKSLHSGVLQELNRGNVCVPLKSSPNNTPVVAISDVTGDDSTPPTRLRMVVLDESHYTSQMSREERNAALLISLLEIEKEEHIIRSTILREECGVDLVEKCEDQEALNREAIEAFEMTSLDTRLVPAWGQIRVEAVDDLQHLEGEGRASLDNRASEQLIRLVTGEWECDGRQIIKDDEKEERRLLARIDASEVVEAARRRTLIDERAGELAMEVTKAAIQEEERVIAASMAAKELDEERRKVLRTLHKHNTDSASQSRSPSPHCPPTTMAGAGGGEQYMDIIDDDDWAALVALAAHRAALDSKQHAAAIEWEGDYVAIDAAITNTPKRGDATSSGELDACKDAGQDMPEWVQRRLLPDNLKPLPEYHTHLDVIAQRPASPAGPTVMGGNQGGDRNETTTAPAHTSDRSSYLDSVADAALVAKSGVAPPHPLPPAPPQSEVSPKAATPPKTGINASEAAVIGNPQHLLLGVLSAISQDPGVGGRSSTPLLDFLAHQPGYGKHRPHVPMHTTSKLATPHNSTTPPAAPKSAVLPQPKPKPHQQDESVGTSDDHLTHDEATSVRPEQHSIATHTDDFSESVQKKIIPKVDSRPLSARSKEDRERWVSGMLDRALTPAAANKSFIPVDDKEDDITIKALFKIRQAVLQAVVDEEDDNRFLLDDAQLRIRKEIITNLREAIAALGPQREDFSQEQ